MSSIVFFLIKKMEQLDRALRLHQLLLEHRRPVPQSLILERLECSTSTFKRLLELLRDRYQAPIVWDRAARGYRYDTLDGRFTLPGVWLTESEAFALLMANRLLQEVQPGLQQQGLAQLQALFARRRLHFVYHTASHRSEARQVSPQRLCWYRDNWYLLAWCHGRAALRLFALSRIEGPVALDETACERDSGELDALFASGYGIFAGNTLQWAELRFDPSAAPWVKDVQWHRDQIQVIEPGGHIRLRFPYADQRELVRDLLRFSGEVEVLSPPELRHGVIAAMTAGLKKHASTALLGQPVSQ